jgi:uncharacterized UPF0160 family protein
MITEQVIQSLYAIILMEIGLLLLVLLIMLIDLKKSIDSIHKLMNKAVFLGDSAVDNAADIATELKTNLTSFSGITSVIGNISEIVSSWNSSSKSKDSEEVDDLGEALSKVVPKKKRRII